jgi:penicillin-binding protein 1C
MRAHMPVAPVAAPLFGPAAAWYVSRILEGVAPPAGHADRAALRGATVGFKTGTSYGFRDAWAVGFTGDYTIGVWVGRPDGTPCLACIGIEAAAPILFNVADLLPAARPTRRAAPAGVLAGPTSALPPALRRFDDQRGGVARAAQRGPAITFPVDGTRLRVERDGELLNTVALRAAGGVQPLRWLVNGRPVAIAGRRSDGEFLPDGAGYARLEVVDAEGRSAAAEVFIEPVEARSPEALR